MSYLALLLFCRVLWLSKSLLFRWYERGGRERERGSECLSKTLWFCLSYFPLCCCCCLHSCAMAYWFAPILYCGEEFMVWPSCTSFVLFFALLWRRSKRDNSYDSCFRCELVSCLFSSLLFFFFFLCLSSLVFSWLLLSSFHFSCSDLLVFDDFFLSCWSPPRALISSISNPTPTVTLTLTRKNERYIQEGYVEHSYANDCTLFILDDISQSASNVWLSCDGLVVLLRFPCDFLGLDLTLVVSWSCHGVLLTCDGESC